MKIFKILFFFLIITSALFSQSTFIKHDSFYINYGVFGSYNMNYHTADFASLGTNPSYYESGWGAGFSAGGVLELYFLKNLGINLQAGYTDLSGELKRTATEKLSLRGGNIQGEFEYVLDATLSIVYLEEKFTFNLFDNLRLFAGLGEGYLITTDIWQYEKIIDDSRRGLTFFDKDGIDTKSDIRNEYKGKINDPNEFQIYAIGGIGYEIPLNFERNLLLIPQVSFSYGLSDISGDEWKVNTIKFGMSFIFSGAKYDITDTEIYNKQLEKQLKDEEEKRRKAEEEKILAENQTKKTEDKLLNETTELQQKEKELLEHQRIQKEKEEKEKQQKKEIDEQERLERERIEEQNKIEGKVCKCYYILFISDKDKAKVENIKKTLEEDGYKDTKITTFFEKYTQTNYYRLISDCFGNHTDAFYKKIELLKLFEKLNLQETPEINCE
jgi:hypothetical protein